MADARVSGLVTEVSRTADASARSSGLVVEVSRTADASARVSAVVVEVSVQVRPRMMSAWWS